MIPLLSPLPFADFTPASFKEYVTSLYIEPERPAPLAEVTVRLNKKGNPVITVRREPKYVTAVEVDKMAKESNFTLQKMWLEVRKRNIEVRRS